MRCSRRTVCRVATNEYGPCVGCEPSPLSPIGVSFGGLTSNGSQATHPTHGTPRRLPHEEPRRTCVEVPTGSRTGGAPAPLGTHQHRRGRLGSQSEGHHPYQGHPIATRANLASARFGWCSLNDNVHYQPC